MGVINAGDRWWRLVAVRQFDQNPRGQWRWLFNCDCGSTVTARPSDVRNGGTKSCGCFRLDTAVETGHKNKTHGMRETPEYRAWQAMLNRCRNPTVEMYLRYGGRGITVCEKWLSFEGFFEDMGKRPSPKHSIDRIDNDGNYELSNCQWSLAKAQNRNRSNAKIVEFRGRNVSVAEIAEECNVDYEKLRDRVRRSVPIEQAIKDLQAANKHANNSNP